jgi:hypothetical protein
MTTENTLQDDLKRLLEMAFEKSEFKIKNLKIHSESSAYGACNFELGPHKIEHRTAKTTPTKHGQFVTIWKRNNEGATAPLDMLDDLDFMIITVLKGNKIGQFIFPKSELALRGIITHNGKIGKRGVRVYPTWDPAPNQQAAKTQNWQASFFVEIEKDKTTEFE